ncbi:ATP-binding cassette domain-containing protein [Sulfuricurvum sp.]|uniref:sulfate/molybdate ABC transporter ATP-binding protein n=1 Tax=Sulfuricurvum sp. TaxID=2025608 RepID=UPI0019CD7586|nr:ATP-binding cassette domain-containing protein [Sulfuricurvum sp.]MBD3798947.1 ATP-binding cassette domain-containing protein [Campylobacterota bacterium]MBD3806879.1 ATP-binding cassette domain-containing protein [Sulfuricurvum sp.]
MIHVCITKKLRGAKGEFLLEINHMFGANDFWAIFGESGIGKTTLMRLIAGLDTPDSGKIIVDDEIWFDSASNINLPPQKRRVGFVFQNYALFEHMSVLENLLFAQREKDSDKALKVLDTMRLSDLIHRTPRDLSGGQRQRVALARAIIQEPKVLLLDEPLSALDAMTRSQLQDELRRTHERFGLLSLMVSHDRSEVFKLADQVLWIKEGKIAKTGTPSEVFIPKTLSSKFSFVGELLSLSHYDIISVATVGIGENIVEVVLSPAEARTYRIGQEVIVAAKGYDPILLPMNY